MFFNLYHKRIKIVLIISIIVSLLILLRVFYIQVFDYKKLNTLANDLWSRNLIVTADRGLITDRNGKVLATNITSSALVLVPSQIVDKEDTAKKLSEILNTSYDNMLTHVKKHISIERVHPEGRNLSYEIASKIEELNIDGVYLVKESKRNYPYNDLLSHVLGYVGIDNQGLSGIELIYDDYLKGKDGSLKYYSDGRGNKLLKEETYVEPISGMNISLTIDLDLQLAAERELDNAMIKYKPEHALIIAMDPNSGEVLAMASRPNFDVNNYKNYDTLAINRNLPIWMTYEPGSTFKIITLAASLEEKTVNLFTDKYYDSGSVTISGSRIKCWKAGGHGEETILDVVKNSCNTGFVYLGNKLGKDKLFSYINNFGFGKKTGIDLNGEGTGILFDLNKVGPLELATSSFGQGISVTPIQQITGVSAAINGGTLYKPYIVSAIKESLTNNVILKNNKEEKRKVISSETSKLVRYALENVVANGTGRNAYIENYTVGGKTGTAQKVENGSYLIGNYIVSFVGFMPADDPKIIVYVAVDNPKGVTQYGGTVAAPIAKKFLENAIDILKIEKNTSGMHKTYTYLDEKYVYLEDTTGLDLDSAKKLLKDFKIEYSGSGDKVIYQNPVGNEYVSYGSTVKIMLG